MSILGRRKKLTRTRTIKRLGLKPWTKYRNEHTDHDQRLCRLSKYKVENNTRLEIVD